MKEGYYEKFKEFIIEWELDSIPVAIFLVIASFVLIPVIFFTAGKAATAQPDLEAFYYTFQALAIWLIFWFATWLWTKRNFPEIAKIVTEANVRFNAFSYKEALIFLLAIFFSLVAVAWLVFP